MTVRDRLQDIQRELEALADRPPSETSFTSAEWLATAARNIDHALRYAVSAEEKAQ